MKKRVLILGCTGSIGSSTLSIIRDFPNQFEVCGISAHSNKDTLNQLASEFQCPCILTSDDASLENFIVSTKADICVNGIAGSAGLLPSILCLKNGIDLALANKETIVMAAPIIKEIAQKNNCKLIPVDSEHSAIFSLSNHYNAANIEKIIITASGGPFKNTSYQDLESVTPEQALNHPTWNMGRKISIDSATLANKGLEVIEACRLFDIDPDRVLVTIHPQSLVHSFIETIDGDVYAQVSNPDMRRPIFSALTYPNMLHNNFEKFSFATTTEMTFTPPDIKKFPMLQYAYESQKKGGSYTIAYNAANEIAVDLFLNNKLSFMGIANLVATVLNEDWSKESLSIEEVFATDIVARNKALEFYNSNIYKQTIKD